ncbi:MAG: M24 family metallopeptidase [Lentihominibacter sp.]|jgi:Xaa-Pro aminopeptidase
MANYMYVTPENIKGYQKSWNQKPHEWQNRVYGRTNIGTHQQVDFLRMREERSAKLANMLKEQGCKAMLLTTGENINYATGTSDYSWKSGNGTRYALFFPDGDFVLYETVGPDTEVVKQGCPWVKEEQLKPAITYKMTGAAYQHQFKSYLAQLEESLTAKGIKKTDEIAVDALDFSSYIGFEKSGWNIVSVGDALTDIRVVKTKDEIELTKIAGAITQSAFWKLKNEWIKPGVTEREVVGKVLDYYISNGMTSWGIIVASGSNTNPLHRFWSDKIIQQGEMVFVDIGIPSYQGYGIDVTRCWPVEADFTPGQKAVYKQCYDATYAAINQMKAGNTTADVAAQFPPCAVDDFKTCDMLQVAHSVGMGFYEGYWIGRGFSLDFPLPLKKNMVMACETYVASPDGPAARLEETVVVTDYGYELLSHVPFEEDALR